MDYFSTLGAPEHRSLAEALGPQPNLAYWGPLTDKGREGFHAFRAYRPLDHSSVSSGGQGQIFGFMVQRFVFMI